VVYKLNSDRADSETPGGSPWETSITRVECAQGRFSDCLKDGRGTFHAEARSLPTRLDLDRWTKHCRNLSPTHQD